MLSVREYAERLDISVGRVHQLIQKGAVNAEKVGSSWVIDESELGRRVHLSRPLSPANSWSFIALLSGVEPGPMDAKARWRLDLKCSALVHNDAPAHLLASWLAKRAPVMRLHANPSDLADLRKDERLVLSGISDDRAGLSSEHELEAYVAPEFAKQLVNEYLLVDEKNIKDAKNANVWLHLAHVQADADGRAPLGLVLADLADHAGPRECQRVKELLSNNR
jgi:excisionase family DNA binding protein